MTHKYAYDTLGRVNQDTVTNGTNTVATLKYTYNLRGQLTQETVASTAYVNKQFMTSKKDHTYNSSGNVITSEAIYYGDGSGYVIDSRALEYFTYDANSNIKSHTINDGSTVATTEYGYNAFDQLSSVKEGGRSNGTPVYDAAGNMIKDDLGIMYEYNAMNKLVKVTQKDGSSHTTYKYHPDGTLYYKHNSKDADATKFYYDYKQANPIVDAMLAPTSSGTQSGTGKVNYLLDAGGKIAASYEIISSGGASLFVAGLTDFDNKALSKTVNSTSADLNTTKSSKQS
jgi:hypothetical protein